MDKINEWAGTEEGNYFVAAPNNGGGGSDANPSNGGDNRRITYGQKGFNRT